MDDKDQKTRYIYIVYAFIYICFAIYFHMITFGIDNKIVINNI